MKSNEQNVSLFTYELFTGRLSVAISAIGDPKVIYLDEPTTGLDPMSRREIWGAIQRLKKNRVVILTSHSMEEADILGDRIGGFAPSPFAL